MDANKIRKKFIEDNAEMLLDELKGVLEGEGEFSSKSGIWLGYAFKLIEKMITTADDIKTIEVENTQEILKALSKGKITMIEAKDMMKLLKDQSEVEGNKDDGGGTLSSVVFNIREAGQDDKTVIDKPKEPTE